MAYVTCKRSHFCLSLLIMSILANLGTAIVARTSVYHHFQQPDHIGVLENGSRNPVGQTSSGSSQPSETESTAINADANKSEYKPASNVRQIINEEVHGAHSATDQLQRLRNNELPKVNAGDSFGPNSAENNWQNRQPIDPSLSSVGATDENRLTVDGGRHTTFRQGLAYPYRPFYSPYPSRLAGFRQIHPSYVRPSISVSNAVQGYGYNRYPYHQVQPYGQPQRIPSTSYPHNTAGIVPPTYQTNYYNQRIPYNRGPQVSYNTSYQPVTQPRVNYVNGYSSYNNGQYASGAAVYASGYASNTLHLTTAATPVDTSAHECAPVIGQYYHIHRVKL